MRRANARGTLAEAEAALAVQGARLTAEYRARTRRQTAQNCALSPEPTSVGVDLS
jgi:hypothetical protein